MSQGHLYVKERIGRLQSLRFIDRRPQSAGVGKAICLDGAGANWENGLLEWWSIGVLCGGRLLTRVLKFIFIVAADVRRLIISGTFGIKSEPPYVGCYIFETG